MLQELTPEQAQHLLFTEVHTPYFFQKLAADYNINPETQEEADQLLQLGGKLRVLHESNMAKTAGSRTSFLGQAMRRVDDLLAAQGQPIELQKHASALGANPTIQAAVLAWQNHVARQAIAAQG